MPVYSLNFINADPFFILSTTAGQTAAWTGPSTADGIAVVTDTNAGADGLVLDNVGESATADLTLGGTSVTGVTVSALEAWTLRDTTTGEEFQLVTFLVPGGTPGTYFTLSERPLVNGQTYETVAFTNNADSGAGTPAFSYQEYYANTATVEGAPGDDSLVGSLRNDTLFGGDGADTLVGEPANLDTRAVLDWSLAGADGTNVAAGFTQDTGDVEVSVAFTNDGDNAPIFTIETTDTQYVDTGEDFDPNSSLFLYGDGDGPTSTATLDFAASVGADVESAVENVTFRINDIDFWTANHRDVVTVTAFDAAGNPVSVSLTPAGNDTVVGATVTAGDSLDTPADAAGSVLVEIAGPVSQVVIRYSNALNGTQGINVSDVFFDAIPLASVTSDLLDGGAGADVIDGMLGDDTIIGGTGDDTLTGGTGEDVFVLADGAGADVITDFDLGDSDGDGQFNDQLDVSGLTDAQGNPVNAWDVVVSDDGSGNALLRFPNGETLVLQGVDPAAVTGAQLLGAAGIPCFAGGTLIDTPAGEVPVETLQPGDLVLTRDRGAQPLRWVGQRRLGPRELLAFPEHRPICIPTGVLGNHSPLFVSPLHGMFLGRATFGEEVFARAKHLAEAAGPIRVANGKRQVSYHHLLFDAHQIVFANGAPAESFYPGPFALAMYPDREVAKLKAVVPGLGVEPVAECYGPTARRYLKRHEVLSAVDLRPSRSQLHMAAE